MEIIKKLTKRVNSYLKLPLGPPEPVYVFNDSCENLLLSTRILSAMIAHLFIKEVTEEVIVETERCIKIFLIYYSKFGQVLHKENEQSNTKLQKNLSIIT